MDTGLSITDVGLEQVNSVVEQRRVSTDFGKQFISYLRLKRGNSLLLGIRLFFCTRNLQTPP